MTSIDFLPIDAMIRRVQTSKDDSDSVYFYDLLLLGEMVTKIVAGFLVANLNDDLDRTRYRMEHTLVHADGIGEYADVISSLLTGNASNSLPREVQVLEMLELTSRASKIPWAKNALDQLQQCLSSLKIDANAVTAKTPLLIWFSNFATLRNKTKGHGAPTSELCATASAYLDESISHIINNLAIFKRPIAFLKQNLSGAYRVSRLSGNTECFNYLKKKDNKESLENGVYCFTDRPRLIQLFFTNSELQAFSVPAGGFKSKTFEVLDYVTGNREEVDGSMYLLPPTKVGNSITAGREKLSYHGRVNDNIPFDSDEYVSRNTLEEELREKLLDKERFPIVTLKGRGGIGKTALAIHVVNQLLSSDRFDLIIWFSARDIDLSSDGPKRVRASVANKEDIASEYYNLISSSDLKMSRKEMVDSFTLELGQANYGKALYIFDNFETLTNPSEIYEWLNNSIRVPNKVLITSRLNRSFKADYPIEVGGMEDNECRSLIDTIAKKWGIASFIDEQYISKLIVESDGHPYIIKIILGEIAKEQKKMEIKRIIADKDKILEALFRRTYSTLSSAARRVFLTLCSWSSAVPSLALESVLLREENERMDVSRAIEELNKSSFIEVIDSNGDTFINVPLAAALYGQKELEVSDEKLVILRDKSLLMEFGADAKRGLKGIGPHIERKFKSVAKRVSGLEDLRKEMPSLENLAIHYPKAWLDIADLYQEYGDRTQEKLSCREYIKAVSSPGDKMIGWRRLILVCRVTDDWEGESVAISSLVQTSGVPFEDISHAAQRINEYYTNHQESSKDIKRSFVELIISIMENRASEGDADDYSRLAWLYLNINNEAKALQFAERGLQIDENNAHCAKLYKKLSTR